MERNGGVKADGLTFERSKKNLASIHSLTFSPNEIPSDLTRKVDEQFKDECNERGKNIELKRAWYGNPNCGHWLISSLCMYTSDEAPQQLYFPISGGGGSAARREQHRRRLHFVSLST